MQTTIRRWLATLCGVLAAGTAIGAAIRPEVTLPFMPVPPVLDGRIEEAEWAGAVRSVGFCSQYNCELTAREAVFWVGADRSNLYVAVRSEVAPDGRLLTQAAPDGDRDIIRAVYDDSIELVVHPHLGQTTGDRRYFHLIVNARGAMYDRAFDEGNRQNAEDLGWRLKHWTFANQVSHGWWEVEIAIPFANIGATAADLTHPWGLRVCRNWQRGWDQSRWESAGAAYEDVESMPRISFRDDAPVVQVAGLSREGKPRIELAVSNPGRQPLPVKVFVSDTWSRNPPTEQEWSKSVPAEGRESFTLAPPHGGPEGAHHTVLRVASADGQATYYVRDFVWRLERPETRWTLARDDTQAVTLQYKVYPYYDKLKARVDISALASKDKVTGAALAFTKQGERTPLLTAALTFKDNAAEILCDTPALGEGTYEVQVRLAGAAGIPTDPVTGLYERKVFPWERNKLGLSDLVIPPFTPIGVQGQTLATVLRRHTLNGAGLWNQVTSLGAPLLAGPMRWRVRSGGRDLAVSAGPFAVVSRKPNAAVTAGSFKAGPLAAEVRTEWDYDGMAKVTLRVPAAPTGQVERLTLEIPLKDAETRYLHACGDGLRFNYAGLTPAGEGRIWDSSKANRLNIVGTFYPYVWVGGGERGLAWFADSDKDWSLEEQTPTLELERAGGVLTLRVRFITQPTPLDRERTLVFGLQATPAKPMPEKPVNWRRWLNTYYPDITVQPFSIMGSSYYYGCRSFDFYPRDRDFSIYQAFSEARNTGQYDDAFVTQWMEKCKTFAKPGTEAWTMYDNHIKAGMRTAAGMVRTNGWLWTPYTNPRGAGFHMEEWPTFQDEWIQFPYFARSKEGAVAYDVCPVRSFQDAALWYYREMMTCFDGIYWDNLYLSANLDTVAGGAWTDAKGRVHPGMGLWAMRDLVRRTALLFHECGRPLYANIPHLTNANLVPVFSFANVSLDWEWQYGKRDFQDRFAPDLTVAEAIGRQCGNIPLILAGGFYDAKDPMYARVMRTRLGVCLVHEIRAWDYQPAFHYEMMKKIFLFGYGEPDCRVYNYWDDGFPLKATGCDAKAIVMARGQKALAIVTDYAEGGTCSIAFDLKALGLPPSVKAKDVEDGAALESPAPGVVVFPLKKHDFRAVWLE